MKLIHFYRKPALSKPQVHDLLSTVSSRISSDIQGIETEYCYTIDADEPLDAHEIRLLTWLLSETFEPGNFSDHSFLSQFEEQRTKNKDSILIEVGPRMNFTTAWSTNAVSVCHACGLRTIRRIERSRRYRFDLDAQVSMEQADDLYTLLVTGHSILFYDRMTECPYPEPLQSFKAGITPAPVYEIPLVEEGKSALEKINREMGLGLDAWDVDYYYDLFVQNIGRNPTNVECFDLSQSNSEHSRHWFFKGKLVVDGNEVAHNLIELIKEPLDTNQNNSVIAFNDNSSSIRGYEVETIVPEHPGGSSRFITSQLRYDPVFTAETHNFPSGVAPFPGAETGTGGRIRDVQATGRGGLVIAGTAAYCVGNLFITDYTLPWEDSSYEYPGNLASPLEIEIQASNGASDYGNKFGEPVIQGYTRSFGMRMPDGERYEWIKPIMFTAGVGQMDAGHVEKGQPEKDMLVVKIGGPAYRIGIGGGAASSMIQGENLAELDFNAVQRGDAEMEQKMNRVLRACVERGNGNPIVSIHDQGAGGNCNVVKEIIYPAGAKIDVRKIQIGDSTLSVLEIWGAEYQEQNALLIRHHDLKLFEKMCLREKVSFAVIGQISGDGKIVLYDEVDDSTPVNLDLEKVLGDMPQKTFHLDRLPFKTEALRLPEGVTVQECFERVLRLLSVGSKRFLTNKVDRSVTGLVARQQCAGPLQLTVADVAVVAQSHFGLTGAAISIGEQPVKTLLNPAAMARLTVGEALTNMVWAKISALEDIKCSGNWMWAAKLPGEGARLYDAAVALSEVLTKLGIAIDGGKDSLSMATQVSKGEQRAKNEEQRQEEPETVKSPGTLVISAYATCPDVTQVITPDIKRPGESRLIFIDLAKGSNRLGGSALAQVFSQIGDESPDMDDPDLLQRAFRAVQRMITEDLILAGHDRSDGGLITTLLEMAFAGNCGIEAGLRGEGSGVRDEDVLAELFSEELGLVMEYLPEKEEEISSLLQNSNVPYDIIGRTLKEKRIRILCKSGEIKDVIARSPEYQDDEAISKEEIPRSACLSGRQARNDSNIVLDEDMRNLRKLWEETSYQLEKLQTNPECVEEERRNIFDREAPKFQLGFNPEITPAEILNSNVKHKIAIIREEGSNSDREMTAAFFQAGFEPWDMTMTDLLQGRVNLSDFRGLAFVGGFSYADVLDSAKGWAGVIRFNEKIWEEFQAFYNRNDTFSLGICNGCQLMALLGWVPWQGIDTVIQPRFVHNMSGRFESRFATVRILPSPSIMLQGMEESVLGIWVAHGEGRAYFPDGKILKKVEEHSLAPIRYVDDDNQITGKYPFNPNGSINGVASLCSVDGRHLAIMPHPERTFLKWQWPWMPEEWKKDLQSSPWLTMFQNARQWCDTNLNT